MTERIRYRWSTLAEVLAEPNAADMIRDYVEELSPLRGSVPVAPDWERLRRLEAEGIYRLWTCWVDETLAGFISFFVTPHHNYKDTLAACDGGHYLSPLHRDTPGRIGLHMWQSAERALRELGVRYVQVHDGQRSLLPFLLHLGYHPRAVIYWKAL